MPCYETEVSCLPDGACFCGSIDLAAVGTAVLTKPATGVADTSAADSLR